MGQQNTHTLTRNIYVLYLNYKHQHTLHTIDKINLNEPKKQQQQQNCMSILSANESITSDCDDKYQREMNWISAKKKEQ